MKSLRSAGSAVAARAAVRNSGLALERRRVGQHRQAGRAAGLIGARQRGRIEVGADQALRRARLLDLGDQRVVAGGDACARSRARKPRGGGAALRRGLDLGQRPRAFGRRDLLALVGFDLGEDVGHALRRSRPAISRSSRPSASPESSDFAATATPSFRSFALPATTRRRRHSAARRRGTGPSCP